MPWDSKSSLADLKLRLFRFGAEWRQVTGRQLATARDGLDFLTAMKSRDDFWAALVPSDLEAAGPIDAGALRAALPLRELPREVEAEEYFRSMGLSEREIAAVITGLDEPAPLDVAIRFAFDEPTPQKIARALERALETDRDVLAAECYVRRLPESSGIGRSLGVLIGTAVLLVGTTLGGCGPTATPTQPTPRTNQQTTTTTTTTTTNPSTPDPPPPDPPPPDPPPPGPSAPNPPPPPVPAYKGVSPRRRARARTTPALPR